MKYKPLLYLFITALLLDHASAQVGCDFPGTCTDPVPVTNISTQSFSASKWAEPQSTWYLTSSGTNVTGTVVANHPVSGCPASTYQVTGSISPSFQQDGVWGYTIFTWTARNPTPNASCGGRQPYQWVNYAGTIFNAGNDSATATPSNPDGSGALLTLAKTPSDIPTTEVTRAVGFGSGILATMGQFRQTLVSSDGSANLFKGRQVSERTGIGYKVDTCWTPGSAVPKMEFVQGSLWNVGYYATNPPYVENDNVWVDDYVGWNTDQVAYYRGRNLPSSFPCAFEVPQAMYIAIEGRSGSISNYKNHSVRSEIYINPNRIIAKRAGVSQTADR
jgi:hypothetical protein